MKDVVLQELINRWERDAAEPVTENGSPEAQLQNATASGVRQAKRECADTLRMLISLLGEPTRAPMYYTDDRIAKVMKDRE